jgi:DNA repair protein RadC
MTPKQFKEISSQIDPTNPIASLVHNAKIGKIKSDRVDNFLKFVAKVNCIHIENDPISSPAGIAALLMDDMGWSEVEKFSVISFDIKHNVLAVDVISVGSATECLADPKEIFKKVLLNGGVRFAVAHCHPSGNLTPSPEDIYLTKRLLSVSESMDMPMLDHVILGNGNFISMREDTNLW